MKVLLALTTAFFLAWTGLGMRRVGAGERRGLLLTATVLVLLALPLVLFTLAEAEVAAHLTFPISLLLWPALGLLCLIVGSVLALRDRWGTAWPLLGVPVSLLLTLVAGLPLTQALRISF